MDYKAEKIRPYNNNEDKTGQVRQMFDSIAPAYDFMNRAMTFGIDKIWRRKAVKMLKSHNPKIILDVATGTGDLAIRLYNSLKPVDIIGVDLSKGMLNIASDKVAKARLSNHISFEEGDCLKLKYEDGAFDAVTVAYGVRNFEHLEQGYVEMYRVLKSGGVLCVVELSTPTNRFIKPLYKFYSHTLIPQIGKLISKDSRAYSYLPESIAAVPQGDEMLQLMRKAGFTNCRFTPFTFGVCTVYIAIK